jgi:pimeloyl-ACP methyl ester carboxylesterase
METHMTANTNSTTLAHDDIGAAGRLVVMLPGAGDLRSEYRFVAGPVAAAGYRVVTADLPGHGDSAPADEYTVASTASALVDLIDGLDAGPAVVVATSFAPAAAVWAANERPDLIAGIVAISPHFTADPSLKGRLQGAAIKALIRGPWAAALWAKLYAGWYKAAPPADLHAELGRLRAMLGHPASRKAVRETLTADRDGVAERMARLDRPTLSVLGSADDHFTDPVAEAESTAAELRGEHLVVDGAGHYSHVEQPDLVAGAIISFLRRLA